jgi:HEPN domain-containing protein
MNDRVKEYIRAWIRKANNDLKNAELVLAARDENCPCDTVCFHCQQAVEKYLKAFLVQHDIPFPRSHNLSDLVVKCLQVDNSFLSIHRDAEILTPYAVEMRYPDDSYIPSKEEAEEAYEIACRIRDIVLARMGKGFSRAREVNNGDTS